mgnify:CR=1 FL=1
MNEKNDYRIVFVSVETLNEAKQIARVLVSEKLAACCSIAQNNYSYFAWQGALQERLECQMFIKTKNDKFDALVERIAEIHPDEVPEIIAIPIVDGYEPYLNWMEQVLCEDNC